MKTFAITACGVLALMLVVTAGTAYAAGCCGKDASKASPTATTEVIAQKTCPVMGNPINAKVFVDYKGRRIYFCCGMCPPTFNKDPEKYLKIVDDQLKAAKTTPTAGK